MVWETRKVRKEASYNQLAYFHSFYILTLKTSLHTTVCATTTSLAYKSESRRWLWHFETVCRHFPCMQEQAGGDLSTPFPPPPPPLPARSSRRWTFMAFRRR